MAKKLKQLPPQRDLFTAAITCPDIHNLPLIIDPRGAYEVRTPGSVYQPVLLTPGQATLDVGPGKLDANEEKFVRDLIRFLYPAGNPPKSDQTPLQWGDREIWLKRNIEKDSRSFRLKVDESDWFYPDFIIWIIDNSTKTQTFGFVDPKGLAIGAAAGWADYKIVSTIYMPHVVEQQLAIGDQQVVWEAKKWNFRIRGVLVSTSSLESLSFHAKFNLRDEAGNDAAPTEADFERGRIVFQKEESSYIEKVLRLLVEDTPMDEALIAAATAKITESSVPEGELDFDLALRMSEYPDQTDCELAGALIRDYLKPDADGKFGVSVQKKRQGELYNYAKNGLLGFGSEKVKDLRDHPTPCEELWRRKQMVIL
jgi:hypothetical protein